MKKNILIIFIINFSIIYGQGDFTLPFPNSNSTCSINEDNFGIFIPPKISHGSPIVTNVNLTVYKLKANNDDSEKSEGFFFNYKFKCNHKYKFFLKFNGDYIVNFYIDAANGLKENNKDSCNLGKIPKITDKRHIYKKEGYIGNGINFDTISKSWIPDKNYNYLWFYTTPFGYNSGEVYISTLTITDMGNWDHQPPSTPKKLRATNISSNSVNIAWNKSTDNACLKNYKIYLNSKYYKTTNKTSYKISNLEKCTRYKIGVRAYDYAGNVSSMTSMYVATTSDKPAVITINNDYSDSIKKVVIASERIILKQGFHFKANTNNKYFIAKIESCVIRKTSDFSMFFNDSITSDSSNNVQKNTQQPNQTKIQLNKLSLNIYPNPVTKTVQISYNLPQETDILVEIYDIYGKKIKQIEQTHKQAGMSQYYIDLSSLQNGIYFCILKTSQGIVSKKIVKI